MRVTDKDRQQFAGLNDEQIEAVKANALETHQLPANYLAEFDARILRAFGYDGLRDYLRVSTGSNYLSATDYIDILNAFETLEYSHDAVLRSTILSACESSSEANAKAKHDAIAEIMEPLEEGRE